jgi:hypothetical protein
MLRSSRFIVLAVALLASSVSAQQVDPRLVSRLDVRTRAAVVAIVDSATIERLPTEPLIDKAVEGAAKKASSQQIISAVRTFLGQLRDARGALGVTSTEGELLGGAQAIRAGIPAQQLERLRRVRSGAQIATALTVVSDLVAREVPVETAVSVVSGLVHALATDEQLLGVRSDIETDILGGKPPALAASSRGQALEQTLAASGPPNGAGSQGTLPSPAGTNRTGDAGIGLKPPASASGTRSSAGAPSKPPVQRRRP